jgi:uracil phosphoribosyltransferase
VLIYREDFHHGCFPVRDREVGKHTAKRLLEHRMDIIRDHTTRAVSLKAIIDETGYLLGERAENKLSLM